MQRCTCGVPLANQNLFGPLQLPDEMEAPALAPTFGKTLGAVGVDALQAPQVAIGIAQGHHQGAVLILLQAVRHHPLLRQVGVVVLGVRQTRARAP